MPLRNDASLWWNLPGVVAAYQPVAAPGPLLARYNMRAGGTNANRAEPGVLPTWSAATGWRFDGSTQFLRTGLFIPTQYPPLAWTMMVQFVWNDGLSGYLALCGSCTNVNRGFYIEPVSYFVKYANSNAVAKSPELRSGNLAIAGTTGYRNGIAEATITQYDMTAGEIGLGAAIKNDTTAWHFGASSIKAFALFYRTLSPAEVWTASRQMAYCDVNPDWNVWGRRRRWYYGPGVAGFQAAWARNANSVLGPGARV